MDMVIAQYDKRYLEALNAYNKALQQRNALLKMEPAVDPALMEIWEAEMAQKGTVVYERRSAFVDEFVPVFQQIYQRYRARRKRCRYAMCRTASGRPARRDPARPPEGSRRGL